MNTSQTRDSRATHCRAAFHDRQFQWAILGALPLWLAGFWYFAPDSDWFWPLHRPRDLLFLVLVYPLLEEVLFRGLLHGWLLEQGSLQRRWLGLSGANLLTSVCFVGLHFIAHPPLAAAAVLLPSLIFGHFRDRHGSLCAPIVLHAYYNLGYFWIFAG